MLSFQQIRGTQGEDRNGAEEESSRASGSRAERRRSAGLRLRLVALDLIAWFSSWALAIEVMDSARWRGDDLMTWGLCALLTVCGVVLVAVFRLYLSRVASVRPIELSRLAQTAVILAVGSGWVYRGLHSGLPVPVDVTAAALAFVMMACFRSMYAGWLRTCRARGLFVRSVCVLGQNDDALALVRLLADQPELGYRVAAVFDDPARWVSADTAAGQPRLARAVRRTGASGVLVAANAVNPVELESLVRELVGEGLHVQVSTGLARIGHHRVRPSPLANQTLLYVEHRPHTKGQLLSKRLLDVVVASVAALLAAPLFAAVAAAIKLQDGQSVLYRQERVGRDGKLFKVVKFRTMTTDAGLQLGDLAKLNERDGPLFKLGNDPRVTRVGRFLRSTSIDELPQLWNVIKGEMSLVGPRPALPSEVEKFDPELRMRTAVMPGITGLWQVEARDNPSFDAYRRLDLFYVENWTVPMDVFVLCATAVSVIGRAFKSLHRGGEMSAGAESSSRVIPMVQAISYPTVDESPLLGAESTV